MKNVQKDKQKITEEVRHIGKLADLSLTEKEVEKYQYQLSEIIDFISKLKKVNTKNIEPTSQVTGLTNIFREDNVTPSLSQKDALSNAKNTHNGYFKVKAVFEQ